MDLSEKFRVKEIARDFAKTEPIVLHQDGTTALVFHPEVHSGGVRGTFVRWKKSKNDKYAQIKEKDFRTLKLDEGVKIELKTKQLETFIEKIKKHYNFKGLSSGTYRVIDEDDKVIVVDNTNKSEVISQILQNDFSEDLWKQLQENDFNLATSLSLGHIQNIRNNTLNEFKQNIDIKGKGNEEYWQSFFKKNQWIFGYGLNYQFLSVENSQPQFGGMSFDGKGSQKGDFLCSTSGDISFTVIVELKTPETPLLQGNEKQRNGAWSLSKELLDAVTQTQAYCSTWENEISRQPTTTDTLEEKDIYTIRPKGIIVIGQLSEFGKDFNKSDQRVRRGTFERFRQSLQGIEIISYDELLKRAYYITEHEDI